MNTMSSAAISPPEIAPTLYRFSVDEFHRMGETGIFRPEDRVELLDGEIIVMSPIGIRHAQTVSWIIECFSEQARRRYLLAPGNPVWLHDFSEPQPDMMLIPRIRGAKHHPRAVEVYLLIEVSETSLVFDRQRKLAAYAQAGVREYWIINLQDDCIEVFQQPEGAGYTVKGEFAAGAVVNPLAFPDIEVPVGEIIPPR